MPQAGPKNETRVLLPVVRPDDGDVRLAVPVPVLRPGPGIIDRLAKMMADAPVAASIKDAEGRYVYINAHLSSRFGARFGDDWLGKTDDEIFPSGTAAQIRDDDAHARLHRSLQVYTHRLPFEDGDQPVHPATHRAPGASRRADVGCSPRRRPARRQGETAMRIAIIGAGNVGAALGRAFAEQGHAVVYGVRDPASPKTAAALAGAPDSATFDAWVIRSGPVG